MTEQINNVETLITARTFLQSEAGQNQALFRRLEAHISKMLGLSDELVPEIMQFQSAHMALWLAGIAELEEIAITRNDSLQSPNWFAYDEAFLDLLTQSGLELGAARQVIAEVNTAKTKIWISVQEPMLDPAFLMAASRDLEVQMNICAFVMESIRSAEVLDASILRIKSRETKPFSSFRAVESSPFLENLATLESFIGIRDEFLKTRANLGLQMRHVHAHGDGSFDSKSLGRLSEPFADVFKEGMRVPLGTTQHDFGADFFIDVFAALVTSIYKDFYALVTHSTDCSLRGGTWDISDLPELGDSLPRTWKLFPKFEG